jgi:transcription antitermination protein NusB
VGKRRQSRELTLKFLYLYDLNKGDLDEQKRMFWDWVGKDQAKDFTFQLIDSTLNNLDKVDEVINKFSDNWDIERMGTIDRNILRLASCELMFHKNVPGKVAIDEAVEIAKKYGGKQSSDFVNGILDRVNSHISSSLAQETS